jgi:hypothetical protein
MGMPKWVFIYIGGSLILCNLGEGLHVEKAREPHIPHVEYISVSTANLTYAVSSTTANGFTFVSGDRVG